MSYILEALRKAEQDRTLGQVPGISSAHEPARRPGPSRWLGVLVAVLLINAVLLVVLLWPRTGGDAPAQAVAPAATRPPLQQPAPWSTPSVAESPPAPGMAAVAMPPRQLVPQQRAPVAVTSDVRTKPGPGSQTSLATLTDSAPRELRKATLPPASAPRESIVKPAPEPSYQSQLPVWPQIPTDIFSQINGTLRLDVHVYSEAPEDRFVLINLQKYFEGQQLQEGPRLDEITRDGAVLSFRGQRFRVPAQ